MSEVSRFEAPLGRRERIIFQTLTGLLFLVLPAVGLGTGIILGVWSPLLLLVPLVLIYAGVMAFRPIAFTVEPGRLRVERMVGPRLFALTPVREIKKGLERPASLTLGLMRASLPYGVFGVFWSRDWGRFHMYLTDRANTVQILFEDNRRLFLTPSDTEGFTEAVRVASEPA